MVGMLVIPTKVSLVHEQDWGALGRIRWSDEAVLEHALNLPLLPRVGSSCTKGDGPGHIILQLNFELLPLVHWRKSKWEVLGEDIIKLLKD